MQVRLLCSIGPHIYSHMLFTEKEKASECVDSYDSKQCAAEAIHLEPMIEPPQMCCPLICRLTCHGHAPFTASVPPTIRELAAAELTPQSRSQKKKAFIALNIKNKLFYLKYT